MGKFFRTRRISSGKCAPAAPDGVRIYSVGDIHGCSDLLAKLHDLISDDLHERPHSNTHVVYLGDYIDRGPDSNGVLEMLSRSPPIGDATTFIKGNHEDMLETFVRQPLTGGPWRQHGGLETLLSYRVPINECIASGGDKLVQERFLRALPERHLKFLSQLEYSLSLGDYFFCHAGVRPGVPLDRQAPSDLLWIRDEFTSSTEDFGKIIVHGHTPVAAVDQRANRINVDTGAYATGRLSCLVLEESERRVLST
ncbi:MAG: metallophosphoesterase family protein [Hyphomicrobium sp.]